MLYIVYHSVKSYSHNMLHMNVPVDAADKSSYVIKLDIINKPYEEYTFFEKIMYSLLREKIKDKIQNRSSAKINNIQITTNSGINSQK